MTKQIQSTPAAKRNPLINRPLIIMLVLLGTFAAVHMVSAARAETSKQTYQQQLQTEVDTNTGDPQDGRNPAAQAQNSLAFAASQPNGPGQQVEKPAANVTGISKRVDPKSVLPDTKHTGVLSGGCLLGYGTPGETCVQVGKVADAQNAAPSSTKFNLSTLPLSCDPGGAQTLQGVRLNSTDPFVKVAINGKDACNVSDLLSTTPLSLSARR